MRNGSAASCPGKQPSRTKHQHKRARHCPRPSPLPHRQKNLLTKIRIAAIILKLNKDASVAQSVVHLTRNEKVACSSQVTSSIKEHQPSGWCSFYLCELTRRSKATPHKCHNPHYPIGAEQKLWTTSEFFVRKGALTQAARQGLSARIRFANANMILNLACCFSSPRYRVFRKRSRSEERRVGKECRSRWSPYH